MQLSGGVQQNVYQNWDKNGNIYYTDESGNRIQDNTNLLNRLVNNARAGITNLENWINKPFADPSVQKEKQALALGLLTAPLGMGKIATQAVTSKIAPYIGQKIAQNIASGIGGGIVGGGVSGAGEAVINDRNPITGALSGATIGGLTGGALGYGLGQIGKNIAQQGLLRNNTDDLAQQYFTDYVEGLANNTQDMAKFRGLRQGVNQGDSGLLYDAPLTETENFKNWFGNSKVVDEKGNPLVVYHGTNADFDVFDKSKLGSLTDAYSAKKGFWFTDSKPTAQSYAEYADANSEINKLLKKQEIMEKQVLVNWDEYDKLTEQIEELAKSNNSKEVVMPVHLQLQNPVVLDAKNQQFMQIKDDIRNLIDNSTSNDGIIIKNLRDAIYEKYDEPATHYMVFDPTQIKSVKNEGTFDPTNPNIYKSLIAPLATGTFLNQLIGGNQQ